MVFGEVHDLEYGSGVGKLVWVKGVGGNLGQKLPSLKGLGALEEAVSRVLRGACAEGAFRGVSNFHVE